ncbi:wall-associated receptor kinase-like 20 [Magnolia sinica]|uniref:wall-associated receptor kinase-like 20 n=1 Tax=Magnolia sinica TaxID=86752 RepID=UPI0026587478|nr:wall-associated receptor kinase-like 20 [Magnolia sinica]
MAKSLLLPLLLICAACASALRCPDCGTTPVPYPLSTSPNCGDPNYKIRCDASNTLRFDTLNASSYAIAAIHPEIQRFTIRPASFTPNRCVTTDLRSQGIQLNNSLPFNVTSSNTIMFLNCTERLLSSPLNCTSTSLCHTYINRTAEAAPCRQTSICCTFRAGGSSTSYSIRLTGVGCNAYRSFVNLDPSLPVDRWPESGVEIQWMSPPEPVCQTQGDCEAGQNATCAPDQAAGAGVRRCFCNAPLRWDPFTGTCAENKLECQLRGSCNGSSTDRVPLIAGLTSGLVAALLATIAGSFVYRRQCRIKEERARIAKEREDILNSGGKSAKNFTGREIKKATNNFSKDRLLGSGGYGEVFKGVLEDGTIVAVKCAKLGNTKSTDQVLNEVRILSQVNHRGLVRLLGCCVELEQPLMVYEYISNGTLSDHLHARRGSPLSWRHRLVIARQTAEGLAYLHSSAVPPIYHRDVKSSNILLDDQLNAKVADFGLSRLAETDLSHISTCAQGTLGYLDPEYYRNYQLTDKSDVYSFGVVLLELLTSQKAIDFSRGENDVNLTIYVQQMAEEERLMEIIDPTIKEGAGQVGLDTMKALAFLALGCLEERRQNRPSMKEIVEEIEYILSIEEAGGVDSSR